MPPRGRFTPPTGTNDPSTRKGERDEVPPPIRRCDVTLEIQKYARKPRVIEGVRITTENIEEVNEWIAEKTGEPGLVQRGDVGNSYIRHPSLPLSARVGHVVFFPLSGDTPTVSNYARMRLEYEPVESGYLGGLL